MGRKEKKADYIYKKHVSPIGRKGRKVHYIRSTGSMKMSNARG